MTGSHRRQAYMLGELIGALPLLLVASGLATSGILAALKTQRHSAEFATGYQAINSLLDTLRRDTRAASAARTLPAGEGACSLELQSPGGAIRYTFDEDGVTRVGTAPDTHENTTRVWNIKEATVTAALNDGGPQQGSSLLTVRILWRGRSKRQVDPARRFEAAFFVGRGYQP